MKVDGRTATQPCARQAGSTPDRDRETPIPPAQASGTQSIDRAVQLLRLVASQGTGGARLTDLAYEAGLTPPTARRILKRLTDHGLAAQDAETQRYSLGSLVYELGLAAARPPE